MSDKKIKIPFILLTVDVLAIALMYIIGAYRDMSEQCTGFAGASSPCVEEYFYGYLTIAYLIGFVLLAILVINWVTAKSKDEKKPRKRQY